MAERDLALSMEDSRDLDMRLLHLSTLQPGVVCLPGGCGGGANGNVTEYRDGDWGNYAGVDGYQGLSVRRHGLTSPIC